MLYENLVHPLTIISTLPAAGLGALLTLYAFGFGLDVIGTVGIILLIGIVKKNGIMLVDFALDAGRTRGLTPEESTHEACKLRFRPILMTTMCALLSALPLMQGTGVGSELRRPLGYAMAGGLVVSQILTYSRPRSSTCTWRSSGAFLPGCAEVREWMPELMSRSQPSRRRTAIT